MINFSKFLNLEVHFPIKYRVHYGKGKNIFCLEHLIYKGLIISVVVVETISVIPVDVCLGHQING